MGKKRAVAYIRVSTKSEAQMHSFGYQREYWYNAITANPELEFGGIYADKGISGRSLAIRPQLLQLLSDAEKHRFDVVFCKSVSRFGRNTVELLENVRKLRELGIKVFFEKEQLDTFDPTSEMLMTIAASIAENELQIYSENMRWSIHHRYMNGWFSVGNGILGYRMNPQLNVLEVVPEEAEIVRKIFDLYLDEGYGLLKICKWLEKQGIKNPSGGDRWSKGAVSYILQNEKYKGCVTSQKYIGRLGVCRRNRGELPLICMDDVHEAIIPPERFDMVREVMRQREHPQLVGRQHTIYPFTEKITCGVCGHGFSHKFNNSGKPWQNAIWVCSHQNQRGIEECDNTRIKDDVLKAKFVEAYNEFILNRVDSKEVVDLKARMAELIASERELLALRINHLISDADYRDEEAKIREEIEGLSDRIDDCEMRKLSKEDFSPIEEFDETKVDKFLRKVTVYRGVVTFTFMNGASISREYNNGQAGNSKGWYERHLARIEKKGGNE